MRPVSRGDAPRAYRKYEDAIGDLEERLGTYCSYCERRLPVSLAVEHVAPKSLDSSRKTDWANFLLACTNCNSAKGDQPTSEGDFLWPDRDNTLRAFTCESGGFVTVAASLPGSIGLKARALIDLVGLNRHKKHGWPRPARRDKRWTQRADTWELAEKWEKAIAAFSPEGRQQAVELVRDLALGYGFFSVWMTVFADEADIRLALIKAFSGTATDCFDKSGNMVPRPDGHL
ncbi:MAG: HNH endonuclease signature motif containing protein [Verrucomicrobiota bacterium]